MKGSTKDKMEGKLHEAKGKVKEVVGKAVSSPKLTMEGHVEKFGGKIQEKVGEVKKSHGK
ncbi:MAG TPA: CsbD family protein [Geomonas sp.]